MTILLEQIRQIHWREPYWLLIAFQPFVVAFLSSLLHKRQSEKYADKELLPWVIVQPNNNYRADLLHKLFSKNSAYIAAWILFAVAAAGPRIALDIPGQELSKPTNIMLVVDISRSMQATDVAPNRLRRAQIEIAELLERTQDNRNRSKIGIIVFAARPHLYVPLTTDYKAIRFYLDSLDELILPTLGSQPITALQLAYQELQGNIVVLDNTVAPEGDSILPRYSSIILLTDGDWQNLSNVEQQAFKEIVDTLNQANIAVNILGVATSEGHAIPLRQRSNQTGWLKHQGQSVVSRMDESGLRQLAAGTGGSYSPVYDNARDWETLYDASILAQQTSRTEPVSDEKTLWRELYTWALAPAIILLWLSIIPYSVGIRKILAVPRRALARLIILGTLLLMFVTPVRTLDANELEQQAYEAYSQNNNAKALDLYKQIGGYIGRLGEGTNRYQLGDYTGAVQQFTQAVLYAENDSGRARALYNLGNSYFKLGDYNSAVRIFKDALLYRPGHKASEHNLAFSEAIQKAVMERVGTSAPTSRVGAGPAETLAASGLELNDQAALSVGKSEESPLNNSPLPELPGMTKNAMQELVNKGLAHIRLADENTGERKESQNRLSRLSQSIARIRMKELEDRQFLLWKRVFEIEEGFEAPQDNPSEVPGVKPW